VHVPSESAAWAGPELVTGGEAPPALRGPAEYQGLRELAGVVWTAPGQSSGNPPSRTSPVDPDPTQRGPTAIPTETRALARPKASTRRLHASRQASKVVG